MTIEEIINDLIERNIIRKTQIYKGNEKISEGTTAFIISANTDIWPIVENKFKDFVEMFVNEKVAEMTCEYQKVLETKGPPDGWEYHSWETNSHIETGTVTIRLSLEQDKVMLSIIDIKAKNSYWTGY